MLTITQSIPNLTFTSSAQKDTNLSFYPTVYTGTDPNFKSCISFLQIVLPPISKADSAQLRLAVIAKSGDDPSTVAVNRVTAPFKTSDVSFSTMPAFAQEKAKIAISKSDLYTIVQIDITDLVNNWLNGTYENYGIALTNSDDSSAVQFATNIIGYKPYYPEFLLTSSVSPVVWNKLAENGNAGSDKKDTENVL